MQQERAAALRRREAGAQDRQLLRLDLVEVSHLGLSAGQDK